ncbi:TPA: hypothetical protein ENS27_18480 [bacterium]|nr:hypothetical protein [bacterium]
MFIHKKGAKFLITERKVQRRSYISLFISPKFICILSLVSCFLFLFAGCGEKDNKSLVDARNQIRLGKYRESQGINQIKTELKSVLAKETENPEAFCPLKAIEIIESGANSATQQKAISDIITSMAKLEEQIKKLEAIDKDFLTDQDKGNLDKLQRKWYLTLEPTASILVSDSKWIEGLGSEAFSLLIEFFKSTDPKISNDVINLMIQFKEKSFDILINALKNENDLVRSNAVIALGKIGDERAIEPISALLDDKVSGVKYYVPISLDLIGSPNIVPYLQKAIKNDVAQVRMTSADILGKLRDESSISYLIEMLADDNPYVRTSATNALIRLGSLAVPSLIDVIVTNAENITLLRSDFVGDKIGNKYKKELAKRANIQSYVITILGNIKDSRAIPILLSAMKRVAPNGATEEEKTYANTVRASAITALGAIGAPAVTGLISIASNKEESETARVNAISILGNILDKRAVMPLIANLKDENKSVRAVSATALGALKDRRALSPLIESLHDVDIVTRINSATSLGLLVDKTATQPLLEILNNKNEREKLRTSALDSLGLIKDAVSLEPILKILIDEYEKDGIRKSASTALRLMENSYPSEALVALLKGDIVYPILMPEKGIVSKWNKKKGSKDLVKNITPVVEVKVGNLTKEILSPDNGVLIETYITDGKEAEKDAILGLISFKDKDIKEEERSSIRNMAALALGKVKGENAVPALIKALEQDKNGAVRKNCVSSLREIENAKARPALVKAMKGDDSGVVRSESAYALGVGALKSAESVPHLIDTLRKDKYESARVMAAWSLGELVDKRAVEPLIDSLVKGKDKQKEAPAVINAVITALDKLAGNAIDPLIAVLNNKDIDEVSKSYSARILGLIQSPNAVDTLVKALQSESVVIRSESAKALGLIEDRRATEPLINVLKDDWVTVRTNALVSLGTIKDERCILPMIDELKANITNVRSNAVVALGSIKDKRAVPTLISMLEDPKEDDNIRANIINALSSIGDLSAVPAIRNAMKSDNSTIKQNAITAVGNIAVVGAVDDLLSMARNMDEITIFRANSIEALGKIGDKRAIPILVNILANPDESDTVWIKAGEAAGKLGATSIPEIVEQRVRDAWEPVAVRNAGMMSISKTGNNMDFAILLEMLNDGTVAIRSGSALALGNSGRKDAIQPLIEKLKSDGEEVVRRDSAKALGLIADPSSEQALIKAFNEDATASVRNESAIALGNIKGQAGINALINVVKDNTKTNDHRLNSAVALGNAKATDAINALQTALADNNGGIHFESAEALRKITGQSQGYER